MNLIRNKCVICGGVDLNVFLNYKMPVYSSDILTTENHQISDIKFSECSVCNAVQLKEMVDPEIVYQFNHNREIVGGTWELHYNEFADFINNVDDKTILEISDPVAKLPKKFERYNKWYIVEPHSEGSIDEKRIFFINKFFDNKFEIDDNIDIIVHSHFFEHTFEPLEFFKKCNSLLKENGLMYISTPNLNSIIKLQNNPNSVLHFEHTFYFDIDILKYLANQSGFEILKVKEFKNHSIFLELKKTKTTNYILPKFEKTSRLFLDSYSKFKDLIDYINKSDEKYILFGCHISSQFLIYNGLKRDKIEFIIDNSISKQGSYLYGTDIKTLSPKTILENEYTVITSHMGVYSEEIKNGLKEIKKNIKFI